MIQTLLNQGLAAADLGLIFGIMAVGVYITFRVLNFPDLTVDGSFTTGAAVAAVGIVNGINPWVATGLAFVAGALAGLVTGLLHTKGKINPLLAGILTQIALYSINLRIMGRANLPLLRSETLLSDVRQAGLFGTWASVGIFLAIVIVVLIVVNWFLSTDTGLAMQATGDNEQMIRAQGVSTDAMKILGLVISNALVGLSGAIMAQYQGYADIGMGIGLIVAGLASVILGQAVIPSRHFAVTTAAVVFGSILYREVIQLALSVGFDPNDMKLISAVLVVLALLLPRMSVFRRMKARRHQRQMAAAAGRGAVSSGSRRRMLDVQNVSKVFFPHTPNERVALDDVSLFLAAGDFVTIIGSNGAGKSTLLNVVAGAYRPESGRVLIDQVDVTREPDYRVARFVGRVFQDPMAGTSPHGTVEQNLSMAYARGKRRGLRRALTRAKREVFRQELRALELGLEDRLHVEVGLLSGGQRQALSLLMATFSHPRILLLDEHTAALDPARAEHVTRLTQVAVERYGLTTMMVTHNMAQALQLGNRLVMMHGGRIVLELSGDDKRNATVQDLMDEFAKLKVATDRTLLT